MNDVHGISKSVTASTLREFAHQSTRTLRTTRSTEIADETDRVEISELAGFLNRLAELPEGRARRIVEIRNAIADGTYETPEKLAIATDRLFDDL